MPLLHQRATIMSRCNHVRACGFSFRTLDAPVAKPEVELAEWLGRARARRRFTRRCNETDQRCEYQRQLAESHGPFSFDQTHHCSPTIGGECLTPCGFDGVDATSNRR